MELIIMGAGGCAREVRCWAEDCGFKVIGFFDEFQATTIMLDGLPVSNVLPKKRVEYVVAVGNPRVREKLHLIAQGAGLQLCRPIVHPKTYLGRHVVVGNGSIICPGVVATCDVTIGRNCIIHYNVTIGHDVTIDDSCMIAPGANISGNVIVGRRVYLGANSVVREKLEVGEDSILGAGAVLVKPMPPKQTWVGNPAVELVKCKNS